LRRFEGPLLYSILQPLARLAVLSDMRFDLTGSDRYIITISLQLEERESQHPMGCHHPPVLKITKYVLITYEKSLLY
jgi:hypothetical protein